MKAFNLSVTAGVRAAPLTAANGLIADLSSPQSVSSTSSYTLAGAGAAKADEVIWVRENLTASQARLVGVASGTEYNPVRETPARLASLKTFLVAVPLLNDNQTDTKAVSVALSAELGVALGFGGAVTKTVRPGETWLVDYPTGANTGSSGSVTVTNTDPTYATTFTLVCAGAKS
ncbi:MAG: hypothetical protein K2X82_30135 [Gemmataceae bacterium]|nr:hypothetical protein [Gemmataceae bacterium]